VFRHRTNGYRVLLSKDRKEHTWDYDRLWEAENHYQQLTDYDVCMILALSPINVKLVQEKRNATVA